MSFDLENARLLHSEERRDYIAIPERVYRCDQFVDTRSAFKIRNRLPIRHPVVFSSESLALLTTNVTYRRKS
jgi:hypothetical protein